MDITLLTGLASSLKTTYDLGVAAVGIRDANKLALTVSEMNQKLLSAQHAVFGALNESMELQKRLLESEELNKQLQAKLSERGRYSLAEVCFGNFAYVSTPNDSTPNPEPVHYVCQACFDKGQKSVLRYLHGANNSAYLLCPSCTSQIWLAQPTV
ncbi:hypothetical protein [Variovorax sp. efr-133-TYG-130]|uniref:hypothetical protein n=1 Tax=Variovorax sp. efr-133-TYG-130 TaxID=3040327 RepID=UPI002553ECD8|nr:hypothetical protein [Variovorax sp. efr-133-TYG-130]